MSINKIASHYYELGRRDAFSKVAMLEFPFKDMLSYLNGAAQVPTQVPPLDAALLQASPVGATILQAERSLVDKFRNGLSDFEMPDFSDLGNKGLNYLKGVGNTALDYAKDNPYKTGLGALGLAGGAYGAKKLYDYLNHEETPMVVPVPVPVAEPSNKEKMLALAKQYGPQAAAALAATGALYGGYRAMKSRSKDRD